jgi:transcriptional regulator with XRE-family HTH domain
MKLRDYLEKEKITVQDFADKCGITRITIYNILNKTHPPRKSSVKLIALATDGKVTLEDLIYTRRKTKKLDENNDKA